MYNMTGLSQGHPIGFWMWRSGCMYGFLALSSFSNNLLQHARTWSSFQTTWRQTTLTEACQKSRSRRRLEHLRRLETASPQTNASLEWTERNHKVRTLALSWWSNRLRMPPFGRRTLQARRSYAGSCCSTTRRSLSSSPGAGQRLHDLSWWIRPQLSFGSASQSLEFHRRVTLENADWRLPLDFRVILIHKSLVTRNDVPGSFWPASVNFFKACESTTPPCPSSVPRSAGGGGRHPTGATFPYTPGDDGWSDPNVPVKDSNFNLISCNLWIFLDQTIHLDNGLFGSKGHRTATTVTVFKRRSAEQKLFVPVANRGKRWSLVLRAAWQTLEVLLESLPLTIIVIHHCTKSRRERASATSEELSPLPNILPPRISLAESSRIISCHNYHSIALCVDVTHFVITSPDFLVL